MFVVVALIAVTAEVVLSYLVPDVMAELSRSALELGTSGLSCRFSRTRKAENAGSGHGSSPTIES